MLLVEVIYPSCRLAAPWSKSLLLYTLSAILKSTVGIHTESFIKGIGHHSHSMVGVHPSRITCHLRECGHPLGSHLFCHKQIRGNDVLLCFGKYQSTQRMCCTIGIPYPVVGIEGHAIIEVNFSIESAKIPSVLTQTNRSLKGTIV